VKKISELFFLDHRPPKRALLLLRKQNSLAGDASFYRETVQNSQTFQAYITKYPSYGKRLTLDSPSKTEELRRKKAASLNTSKRTQSNLPKTKRTGQLIETPTEQAVLQTPSDCKDRSFSFNFWMPSSTLRRSSPAFRTAHFCIQATVRNKPISGEWITMLVKTKSLLISHTLQVRHPNKNIRKFLSLFGASPIMLSWKSF
jgi:hypothetical protein